MTNEEDNSKNKGRKMQEIHYATDSDYLDRPTNQIAALKELEERKEGLIKEIAELKARCDDKEAKRLLRKKRRELSELEEPACFIGTAVYGDVNAPEVQILRAFRDSVLMETGLGRKAVDLYYSGFGQKTADFIKNYMPSLIPVIRKGLDRLVQYHQSHK